VSASIATYTSITDFLNMPIRKFYQVAAAIATVLERQKRQIDGEV
jgi:hypothetical protein